MTYNELLDANTSTYPTSVDALKSIPVIQDFNAASLEEAVIVSTYNTLVSNCLQICSNTSSTSEQINVSLQAITYYVNTETNASVLNKYLISANVIGKIIQAVIDLEKYTIIQKKQIIRSTTTPENMQVGDIWFRVNGGGTIIPLIKTTTVNTNEEDNYTPIYISDQYVAATALNGEPSGTASDNSIFISEIKDNVNLLNNSGISNLKGSENTSSGETYQFDLNSLVADSDIGTYLVWCTDTNTTILHSPVQKNGKLIVEKIIADRIMQTYIIPSTSDILIYKRFYVNNTWGSWYKISSSAVS